MPPRAWGLVLALLLSTSVPVSSAPGLPDDGVARLDHVRSTESWVLALLDQGAAESPTLERLLAQLQQTDTIVYVQPGICAFGHFRACLPNFVARSGSVRYLRIVFDPHQARGPQLIALIGHELQHAVEIARAPAVHDADGMGRLFRKIGISPACPKALPDCFETDAARLAGDSILEELWISTSGSTR